MIQRLFPENCR